MTWFNKNIFMSWVSKKDSRLPAYNIFFFVLFWMTELCLCEEKLFTFFAYLCIFEEGWVSIGVGIFISQKLWNLSNKLVKNKICKEIGCIFINSFSSVVQLSSAGKIFFIFWKVLIFFVLWLTYHTTYKYNLRTILCDWIKVNSKPLWKQIA